MSLEDDLLRIFGGEKIQPWMERLGLEEGEAIEHSMITRAIENAQKKVEGRNFDIRKHLLDYDNVMNLQRTTFYGKRREMLAHEDLHEEVLEVLEGVVVDQLGEFWPEKGGPDTDRMAEMATAFEAIFGVHFDPAEEPFVVDGVPASDRDAFGNALHNVLVAELEDKKKKCDALAEEHADLGYPNFAVIERDILLTISDRQWKDHLHAMDGLRDSVGLRGMAQKDPKLEYQREGFGMFEEMNRRVDFEVTQILFKLALPEPEQLRPMPPPTRAMPEGTAERPGLPQGGAADGKAGKAGKVGRNEPCPCGSGKKYKKCHGIG